MLFISFLLSINCVVVVYASYGSIGRVWDTGLTGKKYNTGRVYTVSLVMSS